MQYWVVPHTHWDREWYLPFEQFRFHLARTVNGVIDTLEGDPSFRRFTLDGQASVLEDYLEVRPEREERLRRLIGEGRIAIGPWYTLPDEFLVGPESLVRNLLLGRRVCEGFGRPMSLGYLPDSFGHIAQMPQLLRGFGLDTFAFWRGLGDAGARVGAAFTWRGPDGSEVLALRMGHYGNAAGLTEGGVDRAVERIRQQTDRFAARYARVGLDDFLLCNGTDHRPIEADLPRVLAGCRSRLPASRFRIATFEEYGRHVRRRVRDLETLTGELCGGQEIAVLRGVNSARMWIKQANEDVERQLFVAEALASFAYLRGMRYPSTELGLAWRQLLRNHAHDSICGCSVDQVHRDMAPRFDQARQLAVLVQRFSLRWLGGEGPPWAAQEPARERLSAVNVLPFPRTRVVELELPGALARARSLCAEVSGEPVAVQRAGGRVSVAVPVAGLAASPIRLRRVARGESVAAPVGSARVVSPRAIENDRYRVDVTANGTLTVLDRQSGERVSGLHLLEDCADRGDEYNFCPLEEEVPLTGRSLGASVRAIRQGPVVAELEIAVAPRLPAALTADRRARTQRTVACPIRTRVRLTAGGDRVELTTTVGNRALDHRLRVRFPAPGAGDRVRAEGHFAVIRRPAQPVWKERWSEPPQTTNHTLGMVAAGRLALFTRGLPEYEAVPEPGGGTALALTLLRCVGWLSRGDLSTRFHHAGPAVETPEAQCQGLHTFEYALSLDGERSDAELVQAAQDYRTDLAVGPPGVDLDGVLAVSGDGVVLTALKGAEDGDGLVLRLCNPGATPASVRLRTPLRVRRARLDEAALPRRIGPRLTVGAYEVATVRLDQTRPAT